MKYCTHKYIDYIERANNKLNKDIDINMKNGNGIGFDIYDNYLYQIPYYQLIELDYEDLCNYGCIEVITQKRLSNHHPVYKYHGHWPFIRYFGLEEPASCIFSLMNVIPHLLYILGVIRTAATIIDGSMGGWTYSSSSSSSSSRSATINKMRGKGHHYMTPWIILYATTSCIAFTCSTIYHAKKTIEHTKYDLISALLFITTGLFIAIRRILLSTYCSLTTLLSIFIIIYGLLFSWRAYYMMQGLITFSNHMSWSISIVAITTILWMYWIIKSLLYSKNIINHHRYQSIKGNVKGSYQLNHMRYASYLCLSCQLWFIAAAAFEIFDFPPLYGIFDAHSIWHAATVPLGHMWYYFWEADANHLLIIDCDDNDNHDFGHDNDNHGNDNDNHCNNDDNHGNDNDNHGNDDDDDNKKR